MSNPCDNRFDNRLYRVYSRLSNRLYIRFDSRLSNRLYNRFDNRLYRVNGVLVDLLTVAHLAALGTSGLTNSEMIQQETSEGALWTQWCQDVTTVAGYATMMMMMMMMMMILLNW